MDWRFRQAIGAIPTKPRLGREIKRESGWVAFQRAIGAIPVTTKSPEMARTERQLFLRAIGAIPKVPRPDSPRRHEAREGEPGISRGRAK